MKALRAAVGLLLLGSTGCLKTITIKTVIENDGSVDRFIRIESDKDGGNIADDFKLCDKQGWQQYESEAKLFEARGRFKSVADIPVEFEKTVGKGDKRPFAETSKCVRAHKVFRCALFVVHDYTETLTDVTTAYQFSRAVEDLIELRTLGYDIIEKAYGAELDFSELKAYAEKELVPLARRLAVSYWAGGTCKDPAKRAKLVTEARRTIAAELAIELPEAPDGSINLDNVFWAVVPRLVKTKKGEKLTQEQLKERLEKLDENEALKRAALELSEKAFGSREKAEEHVSRILWRIVGAWFVFLSSGFQFEVSLSLPGLIAEANGVIDRNEVSWSFGHEMIFPGYDMHAKSVAFAPANDGKDGRSLIRSTRDALALADFVEKQKPENRDRLLKAIDDLAATRSPQALRTLATGDNPVPELAALLKKLGLVE